MATKPGTAGIKVGLDTKELEAGVKDLNETIKGSFGEMNALTELLGKGFGVLQGALGSLVNAGKEWVALAQVQEKAEARLTAALAARGEASKVTTDALKAQASAIQNATTFGDEAILELQAELSLRGVQTAKLQEATRATVGLSTVTGNLTAAGAIVAKVMNGNVEALKEVGIFAKSTDDGIRQLTAMFGVAEAQATTFEGRLTQLGNSWGDLKEQLGYAITQNEAVKSLFQTLTTTVVDLTGALAGDGLTGVLDHLVSRSVVLLLEGLEVLVRSVEGLASQWDRVSTAMTAATSVISSLSPILQGLSDGAKVAGAAFDWLSQTNTDAHSTSTAIRNMRLELEGLDSEKLRLLRAGAMGGFDGGGPNVAPPTKRRPGTPKPGKDAETRHFDPEFGLDPNFAAADAALAAANSKAGFSRTTDDGGEMKDRLAAQYEEGMAFSKEAQAQIQQLAEGAASGLGNVLGSMIQAMVEGSANLGELLGQMVGMMITNLGMLLLQTGAAAMALGALSLIPGLNFITGPPGVAIASGAVALGVGAGLVAIGAAMGGGGGAGASTSAPRASGTGGSGSPPRISRNNAGDVLPLGMAGGSGMGQVINVNFNGVVGDPRAAARQIRDVLRVGNLSRGAA